MLYNLGDQSILFKKLSIQLQNDFDATLEISDKYTLSLAKCIYRYLDSMYKCLTINPEDINIIGGIISDTPTNYKNVSYGINNWQIVLTDANNKNVYISAMSLLILNITFSDLIILIKHGAGYTDIKEQLIQSITDYNNNNIGKITYNGQLIDICANNIAEVYLSGVKLYKDITLNPTGTPIDDHIYDRNTSAIGYEYQTDIKSINDITKYNIAYWPISDNILQYVIDGSVVTPLSTLEDIAEMQKLLYSFHLFNYKYQPGIWDYNFSKACYTIQFIMHESDETVILTGLCDLCVEKYLRSRTEIRSTSYNA